MIMKAFRYTDQTLIDMASVLARGYNSLTGRTMTDLANKLQSMAPILETTGYFLFSSPLISIIGSTSMIFVSHIRQISNNEQEKIEQKSIENNAIDPRLLGYERANKIFGIGWTGVGIASGLSDYIAYKNGTNYVDSLGHSLWDLGILIRGLSS